MAGTKIGGAKAALTNKKRHGDDFYRQIGAIGGRRSAVKGFAIDNRSWLDKVMRKPKRASLAGRKGGTISRRPA